MFLKFWLVQCCVLGDREGWTNIYPESRRRWRGQGAQDSAVHFSAVRCSEVMCSALENSAVLFNGVQ